MRKPTTQHTWFGRVTLLDNQVEIKDQLVKCFVDSLSIQDMFCVYEIGSETEKPHLHFICTCLGSKDFVSRKLKSVFSLTNNSGMYSLKEYDSACDGYAYLCKGQSKDVLPLVVLDQVGRLVHSYHNKFWSDREAYNLKKNQRTRERKKKAIDFKTEFLKRCEEAKLREHESIIRMSIRMCVEFEKPINEYYLVSLCKLVLARADSFGEDMVYQSMLAKFNK